MVSKSNHLSIKVITDIALSIANCPSLSLTMKLLFSIEGSPSSTSSAVVTVLVDDINDNAPVITTTTYTSNVGENLPAGQLICKVNIFQYP